MIDETVTPAESDSDSEARVNADPVVKDRAESLPTVERGADEHVSVGSVVEDPVSSEPAVSAVSAESAESAGPTVPIESPVAAESAVLVEPVVQTVYVHAPLPPKSRGNRGFGVMLAILATVVFAVLYAVVTLLVMPMFAPAGTAGFNFSKFIEDSAYWAPIAVFVVVFVLLVLLVNRAGWWAYILGSLLVGVLVYFATIGIVMLMHNVVSLTPDEAATQFQTLAGKPWVIISGIVAREVAVWFGAIIALRGRRQSVKNAQAREEFTRESARKKTEFERNTPADATV